MTYGEAIEKEVKKIEKLIAKSTTKNIRSLFISEQRLKIWKAQQIIKKIK